MAAVLDGKILYGIISAGDDHVVETLTGEFHGTAGDDSSIHIAAYIGRRSGIGGNTVLFQQQRSPIRLRGIAGLGVHSLDGSRNIIGQIEVYVAGIGTGDRIDFHTIHGDG